MNFYKKSATSQNLITNPKRDTAKDFKLLMKSEYRGENSSVFYTSNGSHCNSKGEKPSQFNFIIKKY